MSGGEINPEMTDEDFEAKFQEMKPLSQPHPSGVIKLISPVTERKIGLTGEKNPVSTGEFSNFGK